jgi:hypothetical protein
MKNKNNNLNSPLTTSSTNSSKNVLRKILIARRLVDKNNITHALIIINGFDIKEYIEQHLSEPATGFVRFSAVEEKLGIIEFNNCDTMFKNNKSNNELSDNLLFALKLSENEMLQCKMKKHPEGFQLITKSGLHNIEKKKFHNNCCNNIGELHNPIINDNLTSEMEKTKLDLSIYLKQFCLNTQENSLSSKYGDFDYSLSLQQKSLSDIAIKKLENIICLADKIHRKVYEQNESNEKMENLSDWD